MEASENPDRFQVKFTGEALEDWRKHNPDHPPADEIVMWCEMGPCSICGDEIKDQELGAFDPVGISEDGELIGTHFCMKCVEAGH